MRQAGLHLIVGDDAAVFDLDPDVFEAERGDVRDPAKREENLLRAHAHGLAVVLQGNFLPASDSTGIEQFGTGVKSDAFPAEDFLQLAGGIVIELAQHMGTALDQSHPDVEAGEELRQLDGDRAAAQHDEGFGEASQAEGRVAREIAHVLKLRQWRGRDDRPGGNNEIGGGKFVARAQFERMRVGKAGEGAQKLELAIGELLPAVVGKVLHQGILTRHDLGEVEADVLRADAPGFRVAGQVQDLGRVEQGFGRHAAAQDAKAADFLAAL